MGRPNASGLPQYLRKKEDGTYFLDYYLFQQDGRKVRKVVVIGKVPKAVAMKHWQAKISDIADGRLLKRRIKFGEAADAFVEYSKSRKRSWKHDVELAARLKDHFKDAYLDSLSPDSVERFLNALKRKGKALPKKEGQEPQFKPYRPATLNRYIACLKTIVNRAMANNLLDRNPIRGVKLFKENNVRDRVLTQGEYQALLGASPMHIKPMVKLGYFVGMRRGEILGLRWDQLDLANRVIKLTPEDTKTNDAREIPLDDELLEELRQVPRLLGCPNVFTFRRKPITQIKTAFDAACLKAGLQDFHFHDLRHCAVTNMRKAGVPEHVIMSITGHKTTAMLRRYDKVDREDRDLATEKVREFLAAKAQMEKKTA